MGNINKPKMRYSHNISKKAWNGTRDDLSSNGAMIYKLGSHFSMRF